jgi:hypothetical protein
VTSRTYQQTTQIADSTYCDVDYKINQVYSSQPCRFCCNADNENHYDGAMCVLQTLEENPKPVALVPLQDRPPLPMTQQRRNKTAAPKWKQEHELSNYCLSYSETRESTGCSQCREPVKVCRMCFWLLDRTYKNMLVESARVGHKVMPWNCRQNLASFGYKQCTARAMAIFMLIPIRTLLDSGGNRYDGACGSSRPHDLELPEPR